MAAALAAGCGSSGLPDMVPIRGEVHYKGKPLTEGEGTVYYLPKKSGGGARQATGSIAPDGTFVLTTQTKADGVMKGEYDIVVYCYPPHPGNPTSRGDREKLLREGKIDRGSVIPEKYNDSATSGLSDTVDDFHSGFKKIELND